MKLGDILYLNPDDIAQLCREVGTRAPSGCAALEHLLQRKVSPKAAVTYVAIIVDGEAYRMPKRLWTFIQKFNAGDYPEIDDPANRQLTVDTSSHESMLHVLVYARTLLGKRAEQVTDRLLRAGCLAETPHDALRQWFSMFVCDETQVDEEGVHWRGTTLHHDAVTKRWLSKWAEFPQLHFVIPRQLEGQRG
ncbi:MAG: hypothetical protein C4534_01610 [Gaiellales bacterium]|nr:MAG: hypothetical protein C4534_01610 [Gaiellales bacterium]